MLGGHPGNPRTSATVSLEQKCDRFISPGFRKTHADGGSPETKVKFPLPRFLSDGKTQWLPNHELCRCLTNQAINTSPISKSSARQVVRCRRMGSRGLKSTAAPPVSQPHRRSRAATAV